MKKLVLAMTAAALAVFGFPATAMADEKVCRSTFTDRTFDNVRVPQGASCTLIRVTVKGTIKVESNARLEAVTARVIGNVQGENARNVIVRKNSRVGGSVQVVQGDKARIAYSHVNGDILYDDQSGAVEAAGNDVGGNVQAFQNSGGVQIRGNVIDGNLQCKENRPPPTGGNNTVHGNKEDQCRTL